MEWLKRTAQDQAEALKTEAAMSSLPTEDERIQAELKRARRRNAAARDRYAVLKSLGLTRCRNGMWE